MANGVRLMPLTEEDRAIFERMSMQEESRYRFADGLDSIKTASMLRSFGSVALCVGVMETAKRSIESRRPA